MKSLEEYIDDYLDNYNDLKKTNELWRIKYTPQEFIEEIEKVRAWGIKERKYGSILNEYSIEQSEKKMAARLLINRYSLKEAVEKSTELHKIATEGFVRDAPFIQAEVRKIELPIDSYARFLLLTGLLRKQITFEMIPEKVLEAFKEMPQYHYVIEQLSKTS